MFNTICMPVCVRDSGPEVARQCWRYQSFGNRWLWPRFAFASIDVHYLGNLLHFDMRLGNSLPYGVMYFKKPIVRADDNLNFKPFTANIHKFYPTSSDTIYIYIYII